MCIICGARLLKNFPVCDLLNKEPPNYKKRCVYTGYEWDLVGVIISHTLIPLAGNL